MLFFREWGSILGSILGSGLESVIGVAKNHSPRVRERGLPGPPRGGFWDLSFDLLKKKSAKSVPKVPRGAFVHRSPGPAGPFRVRSGSVPGPWRESCSGPCGPPRGGFCDLSFDLLKNPLAQNRY